MAAGLRYRTSISFHCLVKRSRRRKLVHTKDVSGITVSRELVIKKEDYIACAVVVQQYLHQYAAIYLWRGDESMSTLQECFLLSKFRSPALA